MRVKHNLTYKTNNCYYTSAVTEFNALPTKLWLLFCQQALPTKLYGYCFASRHFQQNSMVTVLPAGTSNKTLWLLFCQQALPTKLYGYCFASRHFQQNSMVTVLPAGTSNKTLWLLFCQQALPTKLYGYCFASRHFQQNSMVTVLPAGTSNKTLWLLFCQQAGLTKLYGYCFASRLAWLNSDHYHGSCDSLCITHNAHIQRSVALSFIDQYHFNLEKGGIIIKQFAILTTTTKYSPQASDLKTCEICRQKNKTKKLSR